MYLVVSSIATSQSILQKYHSMLDLVYGGPH